VKFEVERVNERKTERRIGKLRLFSSVSKVPLDASQESIWPANLNLPRSLLREDPPQESP
jgi:hypothetical protein